MSRSFDGMIFMDDSFRSGICGVVTGYRMVDFNEATWWNGYNDELMCAATSGHIQGKGFDGPTSCATWCVHGIWLIEDANYPIIQCAHDGFVNYL